MITIFIFFLLIQLAVNIKIRPHDYCYPLQSTQACSTAYSHACSADICSKDKLGCQSFKLWAIITNQLKNERADRALEKFIFSIKQCPAWNAQDVCLNNVICYYEFKIPYMLRLSARIAPIRKPTKCKCIGKYSYACGKNQKH